MIGKITKGKGFRGLADYLLRDGRGAIVAGTMAGTTPRELAAEFGQLRRLNPKLGRAVAHFSLSPSPDDPVLAVDQWHAIADRFMAEMGWGEESGAPWCAVVHRDTDHPHLHLIACRIDQHGKTIADANDFRRAEAAIRRIERQFGLAAVASPQPKQARSIPAAPPTSATTRTTTKQEEPRMTHPVAAPHPFDPASPHAATWPDPFEPGRDLAEIAMVETVGATVPSASIAGPLTDKQRRSLRRRTAEDDYSGAVLSLYGAELAHVFKHPRGAVLYFARPEAGRLSDQGDRITALSGMSEAAAARRIVALATAPSRGWKSITFTGSPMFIELAMREALSHRLTVHAQGAEQAAILARLMAEQQGAMGSSAGPALAAHGLDPVLAPLAELHDLTPPAWRPQEPAQVPRPVDTSPARPSTPPESAPAPVAGVSPFFANLGDRLKSRRQQQTSTPTAPNSTRPKAPGRTGL